VQKYEPSRMLRLLFTEGDKYQGKPLYEAIVEKCRDLHIAGATVFRGIEGFGNTGEIHHSHLASWARLADLGDNRGLSRKAGPAASRARADDGRGNHRRVGCYGNQGAKDYSESGCLRIRWLQAMAAMAGTKLLSPRHIISVIETLPGHAEKRFAALGGSRRSAYYGQL
jgi:hypothetical protein